MTEFRADLHLHSTFSDGLFSPVMLTAQAEKMNLNVIALCDHDTTGGLSALLSGNAGGPPLLSPAVRVLPGVEISAGEGGKTHILGYGSAVLKSEVQDFLYSISANKAERTAAVLERLEALGMPLPDPESLRGNPNCNRAHIAREMIRAGYVNTVTQAFDRWLGEGKPAYAPRDTVSAAEAVRVLAASGALPVLAHPVKLGMEPAALAALISHLKDNGLAGMEIYHPSASVKSTRMLDAAARSMELLVTGGSDFHGDAGDRMGRLPGTWSRIREDTERLLQRAGEAPL